jgi:hypothetical protein
MDIDGISMKRRRWKDTELIPDDDEVVEEERRRLYRTQVAPVPLLQGPENKCSPSLVNCVAPGTFVFRALHWWIYVSPN